MTIESLLKEFDEKFSFIKSYWEGPSDKDYDDLKSFLREKMNAMLEEIKEELKKVSDDCSGQCPCLEKVATIIESKKGDMTYELAKELKDGGFDQEYFGGHYLNDDGNYVSPQISNSVLPGEGIYVPTLEELIEACGDKFEGLIPNKGPLADSDTNWSAAGAGQIGLGSSPKIAVARLWLALNKK